MAGLAIPGTGMGGGDPLMEKLLARGEAQDAESKAAEGQIAASREREGQARAAQAAVLQPKREALRSTLAAAPQPPEVKPTPQAPTAPAFDPQEMHETLSLITALAAIGGALTRQPLTAALNNFSAGVHGYVQGKQDVFQNSLKEFDANLKKANAENESTWKKYKAAQEKHGTDIQAMQQEISIIAAETQSPIDMELAKRGDIVSLMKMHEQSNNNFNKVIENVARIRDSQAQHAETARHNRATEATANQKLSNASALAAGDFTPTDVAYWAEVMQKGGSLPPRLTTTPGGKKLVADIMKHVASAGVTPSEMLANQAELMGLKAAERTVGVRGANVEMAASEARNMGNIVLETSKDFSRTKFQPINEAYKHFQDKTGSTESRNFGAAINSFINAYARAISPSGTPTVSDKEHAREVLSTADSHEQVVALMKILDREMAAAQKSPHDVKGSLREGFTGGGHGEAPKAFATEAEAAAAGLAPGTPITIGGVAGKWQ